MAVSVEFVFYAAVRADSGPGRVCDARLSDARMSKCCNGVAPLIR